jgi:hypothetical protein
VRVLVACAAVSIIVAACAVTVTVVNTSQSEAAPTAKASYTSPFEISLKEINRNLKAIRNTIGRATISGTLMKKLDTLREELDKIRGNTYGTCQAAGGSPFCHPF